MSKKYLIKPLALAVATMLTTNALSEDIDLYVSGSSNGTAPSVLLFLDNTSNWSSNAQAWTKASVTSKCAGNATCLGYVSSIFGSNTSLKQGQVEVAALKLVLNSLVCNAAKPISVNVGLMLLPPNKGTYSNDAGTAIDSSGVGGTIKRAILPLVKGGTACANLLADLDTIYGDITSPTYKAASNANYGGAFFEAFKYFGGYTNPNGAPNETQGTPVGHVHFGPAPFSDLTANAALVDPAAVTNGTAVNSNYKSPITDANSCGNNYILLVGNTWPNGDTSSLLTSNVGFSYPTSAYSFATGAQPRLGDVWSTFLSTTDVSSVGGRQPVYTYAMNVYNASADADQTKLLKSIASHGGGGAAGYYEVGGDLGALIASFTDFFMSISATNSVFASSSLPVSINTQGTYLNQVFIGMFRPDADGNERWSGNLKQYRFGLQSAGTSSATLYLADSTTTGGLPTPAIDNTTTGFVKKCAVSYWTKDSGTYWNNVPVEQTPLNNCADSNGDVVSPSTSFYSDLQDGNLVEKGGAGQWLRSLSCGSSNISGTVGTYCSRYIKTCVDTSCGSLVDFNPNNVPSSSMSAALVNWVAGGNLGDGPAPGNSQVYNLTDNSLANKARPTVHGEIVHSRPLALNYAAGNATDAQADVVVYYGAGDGMLHAVSGNQSGTTAGQELWAFVAPEFFPKFQRLRDNSPPISYPDFTGGQPKDYFFDGGIGAYQLRDSTTNNLTATYIFPSMRRGGRMIYAFNATNKPSASTPPSLMWKFGCSTSSNDATCKAGTSAANLGQTWSTPRVIRLKGDNNLYVVFGGGYDTCEDSDPTTASMCGSGKSGLVSGADPKGSGIFVLNATTGAEAAYINLKSIQAGAGRVVADVVPVDTNFDGYTDVLYAVDTRGYVWRINTSDLTNSGQGTAPSTWSTKTYQLAAVSNWGDSTQFRKLMYSPDVVVVGDTAVVLFGSGNREQPRGTSTAVTTVNNRFFGLRDNYATAPAATIDGTTCDPSGDTVLAANCDLLNVTTSALDYSTAVLSGKGWVIDLMAGSSLATKEQVVTTPTTLGGVTYFSTFQPTPVGGGSGTCGGLGKGYGYAIDFFTGALPGGTSGNIWSTFTSPGIPPSPVSGVVNVNGTGVPFVIGARSSSGAGGSALEGRKVTMPITQRRAKIYRYKKID